MIDHIYEENIPYKKAGVMLSNISDDTLERYHFFVDLDQEKTAILRALDRMNAKYGQGSVTIGSVQNQVQPWQVRQNHKTASFTTSWDELMEVS